MYADGTITIVPTRHAVRRLKSRFHLPNDLGLIHAFLVLKLNEGYLSRDGNHGYILDFPIPPAKFPLVNGWSYGVYRAKTAIDRQDKEIFNPTYGELVKVIWEIPDYRINIKGRKIKLNR